MAKHTHKYRHKNPIYSYLNPARIMTNLVTCRRDAKHAAPQECLQLLAWSALVLRHLDAGEAKKAVTKLVHCQVPACSSNAHWRMGFFFISFLNYFYFRNCRIWTFSVFRACRHSVGPSCCLCLTSLAQADGCFACLV